MKKVFWPGGALLAPLPPALISCGSLEKPNVMTAAWTGIVCTRPPRTYISLKPERFSYDIIKTSGEFVINLPTRSLVKAVDYCGCRSGKNEDKIKKCGLSAQACEKVSAPLIAESPLSLECKVFDIIPLGSHSMFLADIVGVDVNEDLISRDGRLMLDKAGLLAYAHGDYFALGRKLGDFGFSVRRKSVQKRRNLKSAKGNNHR